MEHEKKVVQLVITKYYLLAWVFGIVSWILFYKNCLVVGIIALIFSIGYSVADMYSVPPVWQPPTNFDNDDGPTPVV